VATGPTATVSVSGTGVVLTPGASASPTSLSFGSVHLDSQILAKKVTLTRTGSAPLVVSTATIGGAAAGDCWISSSICTGVTLQSGASCNVYVMFAPSVIGSRAATLTFTHSAGSTTVTLTRLGARPPKGGGPIEP